MGETAGDHASEKVLTGLLALLLLTPRGVPAVVEPRREGEFFIITLYDLCTIIENQPFFEYTLFINRPVYMAKDGMR